MERQVSVGVIGDYDLRFPPHPATSDGLQHAAAELGVRVDVQWLETSSLENADLVQLAASHDALWCRRALRTR
jgi:CTP synthase (UTP-ammonia lyase)